MRSRGAVALLAWRVTAGEGGRKISQTEAARLVDLDPLYYAKIERGQRLPGRRAALAIARVAGVDVSDWDLRDPQSERNAS